MAKKKTFQYNVQHAIASCGHGFKWQRRKSFSTIISMLVVAMFYCNVIQCCSILYNVVQCSMLVVAMDYWIIPKISHCITCLQCNEDCDVNPMTLSNQCQKSLALTHILASAFVRSHIRQRSALDGGDKFTQKRTEGQANPDSLCVLLPTSFPTYIFLFMWMFLSG